ncbi:MAG: GNAT family N-acetyltransferase [Clostridia bacterium]|nr:GNAT family N-acetyltransferase [Clostridia bacterium]
MDSDQITIEHKESLKAFIRLEEDLFPSNFTNYHEKDFGVLFFNTENKTSYDSNHAIIFENKVEHLGEVLDEITEFYLHKGIHPSIYQSLGDEGYFTEMKEVFERHGYHVWVEEPANIMLLCESNQLKKPYEIQIKCLEEWDERIATDICIPSNEAYEIDVIKNNILNPNGRVFVGYLNEKAVVVMHMHLSKRDCCRYDYILVSKAERNKGYARALLSHVTDYCRVNGIRNCFQWPAHETSQRICYEAGFRHLFTSEIGRASYYK